jgi:hypothetical protein
MLAGQQGHDAEPHDVALAEHDAGNIRLKLGNQRLQLGSDDFLSGVSFHEGASAADLDDNPQS